MSVQALDDLTVLDCSDGVAGQFAARFFAEYGARVTLVEPPGGSSTRRLGPFRRRGPDAGQSYLFWHLNCGKQAIALDAADPAGAAALERLAANADVVITDGCEVNAPGAVRCRIVDFIPGGPYANWQGSEMIHQALSGLMFTTGRAGERPLYGFGRRAYYAAGSAAAAAILAALAQGGPAELTIGVHETAVAMSQNLIAQFSYNGSYPVRGRYPGACDIFRCADGFATFYCRGDRWKAWCTALGADDAASDPAFAGADGILRNWDRAVAMIAPRVARMSVADFVARTQGARALAARVNSLTDMLDCPHLAARKFWEHIPTAHGERRILGPAFRMHGTPRRLATPAPA